jgi:hypothetical protein
MRRQHLIRRAERRLASSSGHSNRSRQLHYSLNSRHAADDRRPGLPPTGHVSDIQLSAYIGPDYCPASIQATFSLSCKCCTVKCAAGLLKTEVHSQLTNVSVTLMSITCTHVYLVPACWHTPISVQ